MHLPSLAVRSRAAFVVVASLAAFSIHPARCSVEAGSSLQRHATQFASAADPHFRYEGRLDLSDPADPWLIWQGTRIRFDFDGDMLGLRFDGVDGQVFFNVDLDGRASILELRKGSPAVGDTLSAAGSGRHHVVLFKRSEATAGSVHFRGVELSPGSRLFAPAAPKYKLAMLFFGDSITAGACDEDGPADQWEDRRTHNAALSYGALTAEAFEADYRTIAVSGMGIANGWVPVKASEMWDRLYPDAKAPRVDLAKWTPDVVFVNLGENDDSFTTAKHLPFPSAAYTNGYVALVESMQRAYPKSHVVILRGGMFGGAQSERLRAPWADAVARLEATDPLVTHFVFTRWTHTHPRVPDHRAMADELIAWLHQQAFMTHRLSKDGPN
jgi:lysophospholipase L1-like esterase